MNRCKLITVMLVLFGGRLLYAQTAVIPVYSCENPGVKAVTSGASSSNFLQGIIPTCTVTVYLTGTTTKATIYKDSSNTPQNNPFTANTNGSIPPTYAATSSDYDVQLSGGIPPNVYTTPVTLTGLGAGGGGGGGAGTVTSISVVTANGFQGTVANPTTTPAISINVDSTHVLPVNTGSTTSFLNQAGTYTVPGGGVTFQTNAINNISQFLLNFTNSATINFSNSSGGIEEASLPAIITAACPNIGGDIVCYDQYGRWLSAGPPFSMGMSCTAAGNYEIGAATTNPNVCTLSYSNGTPASASIGDGTHTTTLTTPYTSGNQAFSYTSNTGFSGSSTATNSQTATASGGAALFYLCTFSGVGNLGATGATASGTGNCTSGETSTMATSGAVLTSNGLYGGGAQTFNLNPSGQAMILFVTGGCSRTVTVNTFVTTFTTVSVPSYTNILGGSQSSMCILTSPGTYTGSYVVVVN
jgi:hypothetical protein